MIYNIFAGVTCCMLPFILLANRVFDYQHCLLICAALLCCVLISIVYLKKEKILVVTRSDVFVFLYVSYGGIHFLVYREELPFYLFPFWTILVVIYFIARNMGNKLLPVFLWMSCALQAVISIGQCVGTVESNHALFSVTGCFWNPSQLGGFMACFFPLVVKEFFTRKLPVWYGVCLIPILCVLVLSNSRAAWLACIAGLLYVFPVRLKSKFKITVVSVGVLLLIVGLYYYKPLSAFGRLNIWLVCKEMFQDSPLFGHGIHSFAGKYMHYQAGYFNEYPGSVFSDFAATVTTPYNEFIHVLVEQGCIGFLLLIFMLGSFLFFSGEDENRKFKAVILSFVIFACFSYPGENIALLFGLVVCMGAVREKAFIYIPLSRIFKHVMLLLLSCILVNILIVKEYCSLGSMMKVPHEKRDLSRFKNELDALQYLQRSNISADITRRLQLQEWITEKQSSPESFCMLGELYEQLGKYDKAESNYRIAADMIPCQVRANYCLFKLHEKMGNHHDTYKMAIHISKQCIKIENTFTIGVQGEIKRYLKKVALSPIH